MSIKIGGNNVKKMYVGGAGNTSVKVKKVILGDAGGTGTVVWNSDGGVFTDFYKDSSMHIYAYSSVDGITFTSKDLSFCVSGFPVQQMQILDVIYHSGKYYALVCNISSGIISEFKILTTDDFSGEWSEFQTYTMTGSSTFNFAKMFVARNKICVVCGGTVSIFCASYNADGTLFKSAYDTGNYFSIAIDRVHVVNDVAYVITNASSQSIVNIPATEATDITFPVFNLSIAGNKRVRSACGNGMIIASSYDNDVWSAKSYNISTGTVSSITLPSGADFDYGILFDGSHFILKSNEFIYRSTDGTSWTKAHQDSRNLDDVILGDYGNGKYVAVKNNYIGHTENISTDFTYESATYLGSATEMKFCKE